MRLKSQLGSINGHVVGRILKEAARRAIVTIRRERLAFEATVKRGYGGDMDDVFTTADTSAQEVYVRTFRECFPRCGVIGEEKGMRIKPKCGCKAYFTVDPLDGTKAFIRRQSHGIATMVAMVDHGQVVAAYIGDVNTNEMYGYRPGSQRVFRITHLDSFERLGRGPRIRAGNIFGLLRDPAPRYAPQTQELIARFKNHEVEGGSIGTWMARLWKREVSAAILPPSFETPWDSTPVIGISKMLGYIFMRPNPEQNTWEVYEPELPMEIFKREHDTLVILPREAKTLGIL